MSFKLTNPKFILGAKAIEHFPDLDNIPEIAFIGRSNAGKSTFINKLCQNSKLARTSSQPGKTREINFFTASLKSEDRVFDITISDLPGFGYAKFSKAEREALSLLTINYIECRESLRIVFLLHDSKRLKLADEEKALREFSAKQGINFIVILSKIDRLNQKELQANTKAIAKLYGLEVSDLILSGKNTNLDSVFRRIVDLIDA